MLVEDSPTDASLIQECFQNAAVDIRVSHVGDGEAALAFLHRGVQYSDAPRPDLIVLDLNLPQLSGLEVLRAAKADLQLRSIPVIVLTSSAVEEDIHRAYDLQAACYFSKPTDLEGFAGLVRSIEEHWVERARLPKS